MCVAFCDCLKYVVNFTYIDDSNFLYVSSLSELIWMPHQSAHLYRRQRSLCLGLGLADDLCKHAPAHHRVPLPVEKPEPRSYSCMLQSPFQPRGANSAARRSPPSGRSLGRRTCSCGLRGKKPIDGAMGSEEIGPCPDNSRSI